MKHKCRRQLATKLALMALTTTCATTQNPSTFLLRQDFHLEAIYVMIDNPATAMVLNTLDLFDGNIEPVSNISIVIVGGDNHYLMHKGTANLS